VKGCQTKPVKLLQKSRSNKNVECKNPSDLWLVLWKVV
jgi:hypothetical protein